MSTRDIPIRILCARRSGLDIDRGFDAGADGREGFELAIEHVPDLVITDSEMPEMNGRDLTRALRKRKDLQDIPVLMLTAADDPLNRAKG